MIRLKPCSFSPKLTSCSAVDVFIGGIPEVAIFVHSIALPSSVSSPSSKPAPSTPVAVIVSVVRVKV